MGSPSTVGNPVASSSSTPTPLASASPSTTRAEARATSLRSTGCGCGLLLVQQVAQAADDVAGAQRLGADGFDDRRAAPSRRPRARAQPARRPERVVRDRAERLVDLVRQAGRHLAHRADAQHVRQLGLVLARLLLGALTVGDVGAEDRRADDDSVLDDRVHGVEDSRPVGRVDDPFDLQMFAGERALVEPTELRPHDGRHVRAGSSAS